MLWWKHLVIKLVLNSHIFTHIHCIPTKPDPSPQSEMRARVGNLLQGRSITSSSVAFNGVAEKVHLTFDNMKQRCRKNLFAVLSVSLKFLTNLLKAMNDRHIFSFRMNSGTLEMWEKFALHLMKMDLDNQILVDYRHRRWTVNGVTTPSVSTALKTIRCMFVLPHGDRSRLQLPFSWEKHKLLTCDSLHDVIFFKSWRFEIFWLQKCRITTKSGRVCRLSVWMWGHLQPTELSHQHGHTIVPHQSYQIGGAHGRSTWTVRWVVHFRVLVTQTL